MPKASNKFEAFCEYFRQTYVDDFHAFNTDVRKELEEYVKETYPDLESHTFGKWMRDLQKRRTSGMGAKELKDMEDLIEDTAKRSYNEWLEKLIRDTAGSRESKMDEMREWASEYVWREHYLKTGGNKNQIDPIYDTAMPPIISKEQVERAEQLQRERESVSEKERVIWQIENERGSTEQRVKELDGEADKDEAEYEFRVERLKKIEKALKDIEQGIVIDPTTLERHRNKEEWV